MKSRLRLVLMPEKIRAVFVEAYALEVAPETSSRVEEVEDGEKDDEVDELNGYHVEQIDGGDLLEAVGEPRIGVRAGHYHGETAEQAHRRESGDQRRDPGARDDYPVEEAA